MQYCTALLELHTSLSIECTSLILSLTSHCCCCQLRHIHYQQLHHQTQIAAAALCAAAVAAVYAVCAAVHAALLSTGSGEGCLAAATAAETPVYGTVGLTWCAAASHAHAYCYYYCY
jgi:hypothetical protein